MNGPLLIMENIHSSQPKKKFHDMYTKHYWCDQMKIILGKYWGLRKLNVDLENN